jgi:hypothetical protein
VSVNLLFVVEDLRAGFRRRRHALAHLNGRRSLLRRSLGWTWPPTMRTAVTALSRWRSETNASTARSRASSMSLRAPRGPPSKGEKAEMPILRAIRIKRKCARRLRPSREARLTCGARGDGMPCTKKSKGESLKARAGANPGEARLEARVPHLANKIPINFPRILWSAFRRWLAHRDVETYLAPSSAALSTGR